MRQITGKEFFEKSPGLIERIDRDYSESIYREFQKKGLDRTQVDSMLSSGKIVREYTPQKDTYFVNGKILFFAFPNATLDLLTGRINVRVKFFSPDDDNRP